MLTFEIEVDPSERDKRESLLSRLSMGIISQGMRVRAGLYTVTISRVSKRKPSEVKLEEMRDQLCDGINDLTDEDIIEMHAIFARNHPL